MQSASTFGNPATPRMPFGIHELLGLSQANSGNSGANSGNSANFQNSYNSSAAAAAAAATSVAAQFGPYHGMYGSGNGPPFSAPANPFQTAAAMDHAAQMAARQHFLAAAAGGFDPMMAFRNNSAALDFGAGKILKFFIIFKFLEFF